MVEKRRLFCSVMSLYPVELTVLCFSLPLWFLPPVYYISDVFYSTQTVKFPPCPSCVQLCLSLNSCYRRIRVRCGTARQIWRTEKKKKTQLYFPKFLVVKSFWQLEKGHPSCFSLLFSLSPRWSASPAGLSLLLMLLLCGCCNKNTKDL